MTISARTSGSCMPRPISPTTARATLSAPTTGRRAALALPAPAPGPTGRAGLAAAVGGPPHVRGQHRHPRLHIPAGRRGHELRGDPRVLLRVDRGEAFASGLHVFASPMRDLPDRRRRFPYRGGDFV